MPTYYRSDNGTIIVSVAGVPLDSISWDTLEGGDVTTDTTNYRPGGMAPAIDLGGIPTRSDITVSRIWSDALIAVYKALDAAAGETAMTVGYTVLERGQPVPNSTISYSGILKNVMRPNYDSNASGAAMLQLVMGANRTIS